MEVVIEKCLAEAGINCADGVRRLNESETLYLKLLKKFLLDKSYEYFLTCVNNGQNKDAWVYLHALKGLSANLSFVTLHNACVKTELELLDEKFTTSLQELDECYNTAKAAIQTAIEIDSQKEKDSLFIL